MDVKPGYKQTEVGVIPKEWDVRRLKTIASQITDGDHLTPHRSRTGYYLLSARNVRDGRVDIADVDYVGIAEFKRMRLRCAPLQGDILISCSGHGLGRVALVPGNLNCVLVRSAALVKVDSEIAVSSFIHYWLRSVHAQRQIGVQLSRAAQPNLFINNIEQLLAPLPPTRSEQEAIAGALSDADALIESLEQLIAKKRQIKQGAMQELLTGKRRLPGFSGEWETKCLGDVTETDPENLGGNTPPEFHFRYISLEDVDTGTLSGHSEQVFRTAPSRARRPLRQNDVLVSTVRPNLLSHLLFSDGGTDWVCSTGFCVVRCKQAVTHSGFVFFLMFSGPVIRQIDALLTGSNYPAINSRDVRALRIPLPPYPEQTAIATVLSDMDAEIATLALRLAKARQIKQGMMQELLTGRIRLV